MKRLLIGLVLLVSPAIGADHGYEMLTASTLPKVVSIQVTGIGEYTPLFSTSTVRARLMITGSGAFISGDGFILTCNHLFDMDLDDMKITVKSSAGRQYRAVLLGQSKEKDLALVKVFPFNAPLPYFKLGKAVKAGQEVLAFGSPLGITKTVTVGYVSNANANKGKGSATYTMHTASINAGNSGGPLVNLAGELIGVNVATYMANIFQTAEGMHLAVRLADINKFLGDK